MTLREACFVDVSHDQKNKRLSKEENAYLQEKVTFTVYVRFDYTHEF